MLKLSGFVLLQISALLFACRKNELEKRKTEIAASFCVMLEQLLGLLERESSPMPELLRTLSERVDVTAGSFVNALRDSLETLGTYSFQELWERAVDTLPPESDQEMIRILKKPGAILGRYELSRQLDAVNECLHELRQQVEKQRQEQPQRARLTLGLSLSGGLLLGILLI